MATKTVYISILTIEYGTRKHSMIFGGNKMMETSGITGSDALALTANRGGDFMGSGMGAFWIFAL